MGIFDGLFGKRKKPDKPDQGGDSGLPWLMTTGEGASGGKKGVQPDTDAAQDTSADASGGSDGGGGDGGGGGGGGGD